MYLIEYCVEWGRVLYVEGERFLRLIFLRYRYVCFYLDWKSGVGGVDVCIYIYMFVFSGGFIRN